PKPSPKCYSTFYFIFIPRALFKILLFEFPEDPEGNRPLKMCEGGQQKTLLKTFLNGESIAEAARAALPSGFQVYQGLSLSHRGPWNLIFLVQEVGCPLERFSFRVIFWEDWIRKEGGAMTHLSLRHRGPRATLASSRQADEAAGAKEAQRNVPFD
ncbi:hypothetical protein MG293_012148, partial [Ovis ammon polii]